MNKHLQNLLCFVFSVFVLFFERQRFTMYLMFSFTDKAKFRGISSECNSISSFFFFFFSPVHSFQAVTEGLDNGT